MDIACYEHDRGFVMSKLSDGEFDFIDAANEVEECEFFRFISAKKYLTALASSYPSPRKKEEVPTWFFLSSNLSMRLHGANSFNAYPYVIRCGGMLQAFGPDVAHKTTHPESGHVTLSCTGFNGKNDYDRQTPCDQDFLRKFSKDTDPESLHQWFNRDAAKIYKQHKAYDEDGIFIGDASYIFVPDNPAYEGSVRLLFGPDNHPVDSRTLDSMPPHKAALCEWKRCYKLVSLIHTDKSRSFSLRVAIRVVPGNLHECPLFYTLFDEFVDAVGPGVVKRLILDRGFIDGGAISHVKRDHGVDVLIPLKKNMQLYADVMGLLKLGDFEFLEYTPQKREPVNPPRLPDVPEKIQKRENARQQTLARKKLEQEERQPQPVPSETVIKTESTAIFGFNSWDTCTVPLNLIINRDTFSDGHFDYWILIDTKPLDGLSAALERRQEYSLRTEIEEGHRQLKCFWDLAKFTSRSFSLVLGQIVFVILAFNLLQIWLKSKKPKKAAATTEPRKTRTRLLDQLLPTQAVIIVYCQNRFATFAPLEYTELMLNLLSPAREKILDKVRRLRRTLASELELVRPA